MDVGEKNWCSLESSLRKEALLLICQDWFWGEIMPLTLSWVINIYPDSSSLILARKKID